MVRSGWRVVISWVVLSVGAGGFGGAAAAECPAIAGGAPRLAQEDAAERLRYLQQGMHAAARSARIWTWTWFSIYGALTAGQLLEAPFVDTAHRNGALLGAGSSAIGMLSIVVAPLGVMGDEKRLARQVAEAGAAADPCALLAVAERFLVHDAKSEAFGKSWLVHIGGLVVNAGLGLALALWLHDYQTMAISVTVGELLAELQFNTQPTGATDLLARYRAGDLAQKSPDNARPAVGWLVVPMLGANRWGLQATIVY